MAITNIKRQEEVAAAQKPVQSSNAYNGLNGVSANTSRNLGTYQQGYTPSQTVVNAQDALKSAQAQKPATYTNKYAGTLDNILQQITNPEQFKYNFQDDELFKYYADLYQQNGKQAALDVAGQAAGLTGGYGNSYGAAVANQAYQDNLRYIYDRGMDLRDRAYQEYSDRNADRYNQIGALQAQDAADYTKYQTEVANWQNERDYAAQQEAQQYDRDYGQYADMLNYYTGLAQAENQQWNTEQERQEAIRQYDQNFAENVRQYDQSMAEQQRQYDQNFAENQRQWNLSFDEGVRQFNETSQMDWAKLQEQQRQFNEGLSADEKARQQELAVQYATAILANGQMPSNEMLVSAGLSYEDAQKLMAEISSGGGYTPTKDDKGTGDTFKIGQAIGEMYDGNGETNNGGKTTVAYPDLSVMMDAIENANKALRDSAKSEEEPDNRPKIINPDYEEWLTKKGLNTIVKK